MYRWAVGYRGCNEFWGLHVERGLCTVVGWLREGAAAVCSLCTHWGRSFVPGWRCSRSFGEASRLFAEVASWEVLLAGENRRESGLLHRRECSVRLTKNPHCWQMRLPCCHHRQAFLGIRRRVLMTSSSSAGCCSPQ
jgi:hypothetical protein